MARAVLFHGPGRRWNWHAFPTPEPRGARCWCASACCTLCRSDLHTHAGRRTEPTPTVLGHEIVGRIEAFGPDAGARDFAGRVDGVGDRVTWAVAVSCGGVLLLRRRAAAEVRAAVQVRPRAARSRSDRSPAAWPTACCSCPARRASRARRDPRRGGRAGELRDRDGGGGAACRRRCRGRSVLVFGAGVLGLTACAMARRAGAARSSSAIPIRRRRSAPRVRRDAPLSAHRTSWQRSSPTSRRAAAPTWSWSWPASPTACQAGLRCRASAARWSWPAPCCRRRPCPLDPGGRGPAHADDSRRSQLAPRDLAAALDFLAGPGQRFPFAELGRAELRTGRCRAGVRVRSPKSASACGGDAHDDV